MKCDGNLSGQVFLTLGLGQSGYSYCAMVSELMNVLLLMNQMWTAEHYYVLLIRILGNKGIRERTRVDGSFTKEQLINQIKFCIKPTSGCNDDIDNIFSKLI